MKEYVQLVEQYFEDLDAIRQSGGGVPEESYYGSLEKVLNGIGKSLKPQVRCIIQLQNHGAGEPDGGFFTKDQYNHGNEQLPLLGQTPARGVLEIKPTSDDAWVTAETEQVSKYWKKHQLVLVTNYRDFVLIGKDKAGKPVRLESFCLAASEAGFWAQAAYPKKAARDHGTALVEYLRRVMLHAAPISLPKDLAWFLGSYARTASARIEGKDIPAMKSVRSALEAALGLKFEGDKKGEHFFRSTLVQTVFYGLFSAWVLWAKKRPFTTPDVFSWHDALWELKVPVMQALFGLVVTPAHVGPLQLEDTLDWASATLNRVDRASFFSAFEGGKAVQYFYEPFLEAFDPQLRKELGVWYTPPEIVQYMVSRVDTVLKEELNMADGLADPNVYVLDPCCGTGSYLTEVLRTIHQTLKSKGADALLANDLKQAALKRVFGFEIMAAPFVVSHMQLGLLLQSLGAPLSDEANERASVYLTNALTGWEPLDPEKEKAFQAMLTGLPELLHEQMDARTVKQQVPILVILGNPPYNAFAGTATTQEERDSVAPYKDGLVKRGIKKFNLDDPYVRFFRMAERRIAEQTGRGIVCFISNFSYLSRPSFVVMRQRFLSQFDGLWFDNMNGDSRETGKRTPDGKPDPSVFSTDYNRAGIRVGTAVALLIRKAVRDEKPLARHREFWGSSKRADLLNTVLAPAANDYEPLQPTAQNRYSFRRSGAAPTYLAWPMLADLSAVLLQGMDEDRANALIGMERGNIEKLMHDYFDPSLPWEQFAALKTGLSRESAGFSPRRVRERAQKEEEFKSSSVCRYLFRPYDLRWCYYSSVANMWKRSRPELWRQHWDGNAWLISRSCGVAEPEGTPFLFCTTLVARDCVRGHAVAFPVRLLNRAPADGAKPKEQAHLIQPPMGEAQVVANLSPSARSYLSSLGIASADADAHAAGLVWMHALAIGYSPAYLSENADDIRKDWPRVPLPATKALLKASAALGEKIAALLDTEKPVPGVTASPHRADMQCIASIAREGGGELQPPKELAVTVGWGHAGQNGVVMPGKGKAVERDYTPEEKQSIFGGAAQLEIPSEKALLLLGERTLDIYLSDVAYWKNVPARVWQYTIGGYQVIKKWLSYRESDLLGRPLSSDEAREVRDMARRIAAIILLQPALDENYEQCKKNTYQWSNP